MTETIELTIDAGEAGKRLDQALAERLPDCSRAQIQQWIKAGHVQLNGAIPRQRDKLQAGDIVVLSPPEPEPGDWAAEDIALKVVYEDEELLVIDKPAGLVVHPGAGNPQGTMLNALLHHAPELTTLARAGIVHRLDKDTSGLLVVARSERARLALIEQLQDRSLSRQYLTVVHGTLVAGGEVDQPIGRHPRDRTRMAVREGAKPALTSYRVRERFRAHTLLEVTLATGRTHQIRVHMAWIKHPVVGDPVYGGRMKLPKGCSETLRAQLTSFRRQALHAWRLGLVHPASGELMSWGSPVPADMQALIRGLRADAEEASPR